MRTRARIAAIAALVLVAVGAAVPGGTSLAQQPSVTGAGTLIDGRTILVIGVPGLRWDHLSPVQTPAMWALAKSSARGVLSVRSRTEHTCPDASWLTIGAGNRAQQLSSRCEPRVALADWPALRRANERGLDEQQIGALGAVLASHKLCVDTDEHTGLTVGPQRQALRCPITARETEDASTTRGLTIADGQVSSLVSTHPQSIVLLAGLSDGDGSPPRLHVLLARGAPYPAGARLVSPSTARAPYVQLIDLAPTILQLAAVPVPTDMSGRFIEISGDVRRDLAMDRHAFIDLDERARAQRKAVFPWTVVAVLLLLCLVGGLITALPRPALRGAAVGLGSLPLLSFLAQAVPWWRASAGLATLLLICLLPAAGVAVTLGRWTHGPALVSGATFVVLAVDLVGPQMLQPDAVLGWSPLVAGRFTGIGNPGLAVLGTAALLTAAWVAPPGRGRLVVPLAIAVAVVAVDGAPGFGADVGGVLALLPACVVLISVLVTGGVRVGRLIVAAAAGVAVATAFALFDYSRPPEQRTHLGRFVETVRSGDAGTVLHRKAQANLDLLTHSGFTLLVPLLVLAAILLVARPPAPVRAWFSSDPASRAALQAVLALMLVGALLNDSGVSIPAVALLVAVPLGIARWLDRGVSVVAPAEA